MNRITKQISLVLVSSSLVMHGCESPADNQAELDPSSGGTPATSTSTASTYHHHSGWSFLPWFFSSGSYNRSGVSGLRSGSSSLSSSSLHSSSSSSSSHSSSVSSRGGFGSSAHSVSS